MHRLIPALLLVVVAGCTSGGTNPTTTLTPDPSVDTTTTTVAATVAVSPPDISWQRIDDLEVFAGGVLNAVTITEDGFVAVGTDELPGDAAVWRSPDGTIWEREISPTFAGTPDDDGVDGEQAMVDVVDTSLGVMAIGHGEFAARREVDIAVWLSDGDEWERIDHPDLGGAGEQTATALVEHRGRLYLAGNVVPTESAGPLPAIWASDDGRDWMPVESSVFDQPALIEGLATTSEGMVAVGLVEADPPRPAVWITVDGIDWRIVDAVDGSIELPDPTDTAFMTAVSAGPTGLVAVGATGDGESGLAWSSEDGIEWRLTGELIDPQRPNNPVFPRAVTSSPIGSVAVGVGPIPGAFPSVDFAEVWASRDGETWQHIARENASTVPLGPGAPWHIGSIADVISVGSGMVAVGSVAFQDVVLPGPFRRQAVWLGTWSP